MRVIAHFRGGPWDGQMREMEECPNEWHIPVAPVIQFDELGNIVNEDPLGYGLLVYRRLPGIVAGEVVYEVVSHG